MRISKVIQPVLIVLVVHIIFFVFLLQYYQGDISCLVHAGHTFTNSSETPAELCLKDQGDGYDGQFNYRFALNPFSNSPVLHGISIDQPIYRYQRIFYPFLTWVLSGGNSTLVPYIFVLINLIAVCALTAISAKYALDSNRNSHWSLIIGLYLGFLISFALDLSHSLQILLLFLAIFFVKRNDYWAVIMLICAILTRETALLIAAAILITAFFQRWRQWYIYLLPVGIYIGWQVFLRWFWRDVPNLTPGESMVFPLSGFFAAFFDTWQRGDAFGILMSISIVVFGILVFFSLKSSPTPVFIKLAWLFYSAMAVMMSFSVWVKFNGYLRGLSEWYAIGWLILFPLIQLPFVANHKFKGVFKWHILEKPKQRS